MSKDKKNNIVKYSTRYISFCGPVENLSRSVKFGSQLENVLNPCIDFHGYCSLFYEVLEYNLKIGKYEIHLFLDLYIYKYRTAIYF